MKYRNKTNKLLELLMSDDFKNGKLSQGEISRRLNISKETIRYHNYRLYNQKAFINRYQKLSTA